MVLEQDPFEGLRFPLTITDNFSSVLESLRSQLQGLGKLTARVRVSGSKEDVFSKSIQPSKKAFDQLAKKAKEFQDEFENRKITISLVPDSSAIEKELKRIEAIQKSVANLQRSVGQRLEAQIKAANLIKDDRTREVVLERLKSLRDRRAPLFQPTAEAGFGEVFKGVVPKIASPTLVKRLKDRGEQIIRDAEFQIVEGATRRGPGRRFRGRPFQGRDFDFGFGEPPRRGGFEGPGGGFFGGEQFFRGGRLALPAPRLTGFDALKTFIAGTKDLKNQLFGITSELRATRSTTAEITKLFAQFLVIRRVLIIFSELTKGLFTFKANIEAAEASIKALILSTQELTSNGVVLTDQSERYAAATTIAREQIRLLRTEALKTAATFEDLLFAFQTAIAPGAQAGFALEDIRKFSILISQAATALGLQQNQLAEEIRSLVQGTIQVRTTRIATALGISNDDIRTARRAGTLLEFLNGKLKEFGEVAERSQQNFTVLFTNVKDGFKGLVDEAFTDFLEDVRDLLKDIRDFLIDPNANPIQFNAQALEVLAPLQEAARTLLSTARDAITSLGLDKAIRLAKSLGSAIKSIGVFLIGFSEGLITAFSKINEFALAFFRGLGLGVENLRDIGKALGTIIANLIVAKTIFNIINQAALTLVTFLTTIITSILAISEVISLIRGNVTRIGIGIAKLSAFTGIALLPILKKIGIIIAILATAIEIIAQTFNTDWLTVLQKIANTISFITGIVSRLIKIIAKFTAFVIRANFKLLRGDLKGILTDARNLSKVVRREFEGVKESFKEAFDIPLSDLERVEKTTKDIRSALATGRFDFTEEFTTVNKELEEILKKIKVASKIPLIDPDLPGASLLRDIELKVLNATEKINQEFENQIGLVNKSKKALEDLSTTFPSKAVFDEKIVDISSLLAARKELESIKNVLEKDLPRLQQLPFLDPFKRDALLLFTEVSQQINNIDNQIAEIETDINFKVALDRGQLKNEFAKFNEIEQRILEIRKSLEELPESEDRPGATRRGTEGSRQRLALEKELAQALENRKKIFDDIIQKEQEFLNKNEQGIRANIDLLAASSDAIDKISKKREDLTLTISISEFLETTRAFEEQKLAIDKTNDSLSIRNKFLQDRIAITNAQDLLDIEKETQLELLGINESLEESTRQVLKLEKELEQVNSILSLGKQLLEDARSLPGISSEELEALESSLDLIDAFVSSFEEALQLQRDQIQLSRKSALAAKIQEEEKAARELNRQLEKTNKALRNEIEIVQARIEIASDLNLSDFEREFQNLLVNSQADANQLNQELEDTKEQFKDIAEFLRAFDNFIGPLEEGVRDPTEKRENLERLKEQIRLRREALILREKTARAERFEKIAENANIAALRDLSQSTDLLRKRRDLLKSLTDIDFGPESETEKERFRILEQITEEKISSDEKLLELANLKADAEERLNRARQDTEFPLEGLTRLETTVQLLQQQIDLEQNLFELRKKGITRQEEFARAPSFNAFLEEARDTLGLADKIVTEFFSSLSSTLSDTLVDALDPNADKDEIFDNWRKFLRNIAGLILESQIKNAIAQVFSAPAGGGGPVQTAGLVNIIQSIFPGRARGGIVPGSATIPGFAQGGSPDTALIRAQPGEYVVRRSIVSQPGVGAFLEALNSGLFPTSILGRLNRSSFSLPSSTGNSFQGGGLVTSSSDGNGSSKEPQPVLVVNERLFRTLLDNGGKTELFKTVRTNRSEFRNLLGI